LPIFSTGVLLHEEGGSNSTRAVKNTRLHLDYGRPTIRHQIASHDVLISLPNSQQTSAAKHASLRQRVCVCGQAKGAGLMEIIENRQTFRAYEVRGSIPTSLAQALQDNTRRERRAAHSAFSRAYHEVRRDLERTGRPAAFYTARCAPRLGYCLLRVHCWMADSSINIVIIDIVFAAGTDPDPTTPQSIFDIADGKVRALSRGVLSNIMGRWHHQQTWGRPLDPEGTPEWRGCIHDAQQPLQKSDEDRPALLLAAIRVGTNADLPVANSVDESSAMASKLLPSQSGSLETLHPTRLQLLHKSSTLSKDEPNGGAAHELEPA
jgi:hypothetical protein